MNREFWTDERIAGSLLVASMLILLLALVILIVSGAIPGFTAVLRGSLAEVAPYADILRLLSLLFVVGWIVQLLGLSLLTRLLLRARGEQLATLSFTLFLVATILAVIYLTFRMSVEFWAAEEAARTSSVPGLLEPLSIWTNSFFRIATRVYYLATIGVGWAILRTGLLAPRVGLLAIGWSLLWLLVGLFGVGAPAIPLIMPFVIGVVLLRK